MKLLLYFYHFIQVLVESRFSYTSGSNCQADRCQMTLLFFKPIQSNIIRKKNTVIGSNRYKLRLHTDNPNKEYLTNRVSTQIKGWVGTGAQEWRTAKKAADKKSLSTWLKQPLQPRPQLISFLSQWKIHVENFTYRPSFETLNSGRTLQKKKTVY